MGPPTHYKVFSVYQENRRTNMLTDARMRKIFGKNPSFYTRKKRKEMMIRLSANVDIIFQDLLRVEPVALNTKKFQKRQKFTKQRIMDDILREYRTRTFHYNTMRTEARPHSQFGTNISAGFTADGIGKQSKHAGLRRQTSKV